MGVAMHAVVFVGVQASGKSTFFRERFADTHVRINLDMLRTRRREQRLIETCIEIGQPFVIDNTNVTREDRARYLPLLTDNGIPAIGYYFRSGIAECLERNADRPEGARVPEPGILGTHARLELPDPAEGFAELSYVRLDGLGGFVVERWKV